MLALAGTKENVIQTGTVNLHFLIPGTSEPISATVSISDLSLHAVFLCVRYLVCIDDWRLHLETLCCRCTRHNSISLQWLGTLLWGGGGGKL